MSDLRFLSIIPAEDPVYRSKGLNLLLMVENLGEDRAAEVRFFAGDGRVCREIFSQRREFEGYSHIHAYFHLPPACFAPENWDGEAPEELELWAGEEAPKPGQHGMLLFLEP